MRFLLAIILFLGTLGAAAQKEGDGTPWYPLSQTTSLKVTVPRRIDLVLPTNSTSIHADAVTTTAGSTVTRYYWTQLTTNRPDRITTPTNSSEVMAASGQDITVSKMAKGFSIYRLWVRTTTSGVDSVFYSDVLITVSDAGTAAINAGNDTTLWKNVTWDKGTEKFRLIGQYSKGATAYKWTQVSGPNTATIVSPTAANTDVTGIILGTYTFQLSITTASGTLTQTVTSKFRDLQEKDALPCRTGGGKKLELVPTKSGTYIKPDGQQGTWNEWRDIYDVKGYVKTTTGVDLLGGDTLLMQGADSTAFLRLNGFGGNFGCDVILQPKGQPVIVRGKSSQFAFGTTATVYRDSSTVSHVVLDGTALRGQGYYYGFQHDNGNLFKSAVTAADSTTLLGTVAAGALSAESVTNFTVRGFYSFGTKWIQIQRHVGYWGWWRFNKFEQRNINIYDSRIQYTYEEGMYIGATDVWGQKELNQYQYQPRMDTVRIMHNMVVDTRWDGIQVAGASHALIKYNIVINAGRQNYAGQQAGITLGGATNGSIDSNFVFQSTGSSLETFGYGTTYVRGNIGYYAKRGDGTTSAIFQKTEAQQPETERPLMTPVVVGNVLQLWEDQAIEQLNTFADGGFISKNKFITGSTVASVVKEAANVGLYTDNSTQSSFPISVPVPALPSGSAGAVYTITQGTNSQTFYNNVDGSIAWLASLAYGTAFVDPVYVEGDGVQDAPAANTDPVADAGVDRYITLPTTSVGLSGSGSDKEGPVTYKWSLVEAPAGAPAVVFSSTTTTAISVSNLTSVGYYLFGLTVTDNQGATATDQVKVTVLPATSTQPNQPPVVSAGTDQQLVQPTSATTLTGSASDPDGTIASYQWSQLSGPSTASFGTPTTASTLVTKLGVGVYSFRLLVQDNNGASAAATVTVTIVLKQDVKQSAGTDSFITKPDRRRKFQNQ